MSNRLSVRRDDELNESLAVLSAAGWTTTEAVRYALRVLSDAHRGAYDAGLAPVGTAVEVVACTVEASAVQVSDGGA